MLLPIEFYYIKNEWSTSFTSERTFHSIGKYKKTPNILPHIKKKDTIYNEQDSNQPTSRENSQSYPYY